MTSPDNGPVVLERDTARAQSLRPLDIAFADYDRHRPLVDGRVKAKGLALKTNTAWIGDFCTRPVYEQYDAAEMSLSWYVAARCRGEPVVALPIFPLRMPVLAYVLVSYLLVTNLMRTRDGRALVAIRDHYLSAEIMGINLTKYRTLSFGLAAFFAGIAGALYAHYQLVVSNEGFGIERSILFLAMIIIGGTGSIMGTLMGTAFVVLLPESMEWISAGLKGSAIDKALSLNNNITFLREIAIGLIIIAFLMFEPDGLAHRWRQIKTYWKLYPFSH